MISLFRAKVLAAVALALGAAGMTSAAHARSDVYFSVGVQAGPGVFQEPAPVYVQPQPVYVQPAPVYVQPQSVYVQPAPLYVQPRPVYVQPRPVYVQPPPVYAAPPEVYVRRGPPAYGYAYDEDERARGAEWRHRYWRHQHRDWNHSRGRDRD
jgi:hypothetical protein